MAAPTPPGGPGAPDSSIQAGATIECRLAGSVADGPLRVALVTALEGLAARPPARVRQHEVVLRAPGGGGDVRLVRDLLDKAAPSGGEAGCPADAGPPARTWEVRHHGQRVRGRGAAALPAACRPLSVSTATGADVPAFFEGAGFARRHECVRDGHAAALARGGVVIRVSVVAWARVGAAGGAGGADAAPDPLPPPGGAALVEATALAGEADYAAAAAALGSLAESLRPWVALVKE